MRVIFCNHLIRQSTHVRHIAKAVELWHSRQRWKAFFEREGRTDGADILSKPMKLSKQPARYCQMRSSDIDEDYYTDVKTEVMQAARLAMRRWQHGDKEVMVPKLVRLGLRMLKSLDLAVLPTDKDGEYAVTSKGDLVAAKLRKSVAKNTKR